MNYIDLFSGCGGLTLGLHKAGIQGLFAVEKNEDAFSTLKYNLIDRTRHFVWPSWLPVEPHNIEEIIQQYNSKLSLLKGGIDMLAGGPPCQGFSLAGRRLQGDKRNNLVYFYIKLVELLKPKFIFFENVIGFTMPFRKDDKVKVYSSEVITSLQKIGYFIKFKLVDFSDFGIPQKRKRFILFGVKKKDKIGEGFPQFFFEELSKRSCNFCIKKGLPSNHVNLEEAIDDLLKKNGTYVDKKFPRFLFGKYSKPHSSYQRLMRLGIEQNALPDSHRFANHSELIKARYSTAIQKHFSPEEYKHFFNLSKSSTMLLRKSYPAPTLTTLPDDYIHYEEPRILTVREYARIQSFPDDYIFQGRYTTGGKQRIKEVPRYSQIGNAIPPLFGELAGQIIKDLFFDYE